MSVRHDSSLVRPVCFPKLHGLRYCPPDLSLQQQRPRQAHPSALSMRMRSVKVSRPTERMDDGSGVAESESRIVSPVTDMWTQASPSWQRDDFRQMCWDMWAPLEVLGDGKDEVPGLLRGERCGLDGVQEEPILLQVDLCVEEYGPVELVQLGGVQLRN